MAPSSAGTAVLHPDAIVSAILEFPQARPIRDMQRVTALFCGLLHDSGHTVRFTNQSASKETRIEADNVTLSLSVAENRLAVLLDCKQPDAGTASGNADYILARLVRAACSVLRPSGVLWLDIDRVLPAGAFLSAFLPVRPRRVRSRKTGRTTARPSGSGVAIWPNRPSDLPENRTLVVMPKALLHEDAGLRRYSDWHPSREPAESANRFPAEPIVQRVSSWTLTGATAALCPPAGASMAVLNIAKRSNLRLNLHALTLALVILSLHQSGALGGMARALRY